MEHNKALVKGCLDNCLSQMGIGIATVGLAIIMAQSYCTISSYFELGLAVLASGVAVVIIGWIWWGKR